MTRQDLHIFGKHSAHVEVGFVRGSRSLAFYLLEIEFVFRTEAEQPPEKFVLFGLGGELHVRIEGGEQSFVGRLAPKHDVGLLEFHSHTREVRATLWTAIDPRTLEAIESRRAGKPIEFYVFMGAVAQGGADLSKPSATLNIPLSRHRWAEILEQMRVSTSVWVDVPVFADSGKSKVARAATRALSSQRLMDQGESQAAIKECRSAVEPLRDKALEKQALPKLAQERSKEERVALLQRTLFELCSAASHEDSTTAAFTWTRRDAELAVAISAALVRYASRA